MSEPINNDHSHKKLPQWHRFSVFSRTRKVLPDIARVNSTRHAGITKDGDAMQHKRRINRGSGLLCAIRAFVVLMVAHPVTPASAAGCIGSGVSNCSFNVKYTNANDRRVGRHHTIGHL